MNGIGNSDVNLYPFLEIYCDSLNSMDFSQIISGAAGDYFKPLSGYKERLSSKYTYWLHVTVRNFDITDAKVGLYIPLVDHIVNVYTITDSTIKTQETGFFINSDKNDEIIPLSNIIQINGTGEIDFYLKKNK